MLQYATFYFLRLNSIKPAVREVAEIRWEKDANLQYVQNILDTRPQQPTVIIGTLFKEMPLKPSILKNIVGTLGTRKFANGQYVSEEDYAVLEDGSGRVRIKRGEAFAPERFISGSILALKGSVDKNGFFEVRDWCYAGIPFASPIPKGVTLGASRGLYEGLEGREFVALVSGLEFGAPGDVMGSEVLLRFLRGEMFSSPNHVKLAS